MKLSIILGVIFMFLLGFFGHIVYDDGINSCTNSGNCPTKTPVVTLTNTPVYTDTEVPSETPTCTSAPTETEVPTATATATPETPTATPTETNTTIPTEMETATPTSTSPTSTQTPTQTETPTEMIPTATPLPPKAGNANSDIAYPGRLMGTIFMDGHTYKLYEGVEDSDGSLLLPSAERGVAIYNNVFWVHRAWNTGWLNLKIGDYVLLNMDYGMSYLFQVEVIDYLPYGNYPNKDMWYIATCTSTDGEYWTGIQLYGMRLLK